MKSETIGRRCPAGGHALSTVVVADTKENAITRWGDVLANRHRLDLNLAHISNTSTHDKNAGEEEFYITYAITF